MYPWLYKGRSCKNRLSMNQYTYASERSLSGLGLDLARLCVDGAEWGVRVDRTKSSSKLTPVALAIGIAILDPDLLGATGGFFKSVE